MPLNCRALLVDRFAGSRTRLVVTGSDRSSRPTVEVAHEALIRTWPRLRKWVDVNRDKLRARAAVVQAKAVWEEQGRREDLLLPAGFQLERARVVAADPGDITIDDIKVFIDESEAADTRRRAEDRERRRQAAELEAANARAEIAERARQQKAADLEVANVRAEIAERERQQKVVELEAAQAREEAAKARAETAESDRRQRVAELEAAQTREQAANAMAAASRRVTQRTLVGLAAAFVLAVIAGGMWYYARSQAVLAEANFREGQRTESLVRTEQAKQAGADAVTAALLALEGLPDSASADDAQRTRPFVKRHGTPFTEPASSSVKAWF
jgi:hypothetical protein